MCSSVNIGLGKEESGQILSRIDLEGKRNHLKYRTKGRKFFETLENELSEILGKYLVMKGPSSESF